MFKFKNEIINQHFRFDLSKISGDELDVRIIHLEMKSKQFMTRTCFDFQSHLENFKKFGSQAEPNSDGTGLSEAKLNIF